MSKQHKYMIDTSVWIDYLRDSNKELNDLLSFSWRYGWTHKINPASHGNWPAYFHS